MEEIEMILSGAPVYLAEQRRNIISVPIVNEIGGPDQYLDVCYHISNAEPQDLVQLQINSGGGRVDGALHILSALHQTQAETSATIYGDCSSAATFLFFACDTWTVFPYSTMLLHSSSYGMEGKTQDVLARAEHEKKWLKQFSKEVYSGFLTQKEIELVVKGHEFYFTGDEIEKRLENLIRYREKNMEE